MSPYALARPLLDLLPPETAHDATLAALALGFGPRARRAPDPALAVTAWGLSFANPLGLAAGFDKDARVIGPVLDMGFGFVEVGTVTPRPQPGNPKPRVFRLAEDGAAINRLGFNSRGAEAAAERLGAWRAGGRMGIVGVNIGKNKETSDAAADYREGARRLGAYADYLVINISSPNTPGLRDLQAAKDLEGLLAAVGDGLADLPGGAPPVLVKIAPDMADETLADIAALAVAGRMDGLVVSNTTVARPEGLRSRFKDEAGGLSGRPLMAPSTRVLAECRRATGGKVPMIGVGGVAGPEDAYAKIRAGASLVALYTALALEGPGLIPRILDGLGPLMRADGFANIAEAVGAEHR